MTYPEDFGMVFNQAQDTPSCVGLS